MKRKDIFSKRRRSEIMTSIKGKNTKIERQLNERLKKEGLIFDKHAALPGTPDFVFPKEKLAVFCHGDFWHGLNYEWMKPKLNAYWRNKIESNMKRDKKVIGRLNRIGWKVLTLKGSEISKDTSRCVDIIKRRLLRAGRGGGMERNWEWFCMRYHEKLGCAEIARKYKVTRQLVNQTVIRKAYEMVQDGNKKAVCPVCNKMVALKQVDIKTNRYDKWRKYTSQEIAYIKRNIRKKTPEQIAKHLKRTVAGTAAKIRRMESNK